MILIRVYRNDRTGYMVLELYPIFNPTTALSTAAIACEVLVFSLLHSPSVARRNLFPDSQQSVVRLRNISSSRPIVCKENQRVEKILRQAVNVVYSPICQSNLVRWLLFARFLPLSSTGGTSGGLPGAPLIAKVVTRTLDESARA